MKRELNQMLTWALWIINGLGPELLPKGFMLEAALEERERRLMGQGTGPWSPLAVHCSFSKHCLGHVKPLAFCLKCQDRNPRGLDLLVEPERACRLRGRSAAAGSETQGLAGEARLAGLSEGLRKMLGAVASPSMYPILLPDLSWQPVMGGKEAL